MYSPRKKQFTEIFNNGGFGGTKESLSGIGSELAHTEEIRDYIPGLLKSNNIKSIIDAPCGDFNWMKEVELSDVDYLGVDIVDELVNINMSKYGKKNIRFQYLDIVADQVPKKDLIICRDCLIHLSLADCVKVIRNFKSSGSSFLLTTSFPAVERNAELDTNFFRPLNLEMPPFNFPKPIYEISEKCKIDQGKYADKILSLWRLEDLSC